MKNKKVVLGMSSSIFGYYRTLRKILALSGLKYHGLFAQTLALIIIIVIIIIIIIMKII